MVKGAIAGQAIGAVGQAVGSMFNMIGQINQADAMRAQTAAQKYQARRSIEGLRHQTIGSRVGEQLQRASQQDVLAQQLLLARLSGQNVKERTALEDKRVMRDLALNQFLQERQRERERKDYWEKKRIEDFELQRKRQRQLDELRHRARVQNMQRMQANQRNMANFMGQQRNAQQMMMMQRQQMLAMQRNQMMQRNPMMGYNQMMNPMLRMGGGFSQRPTPQFNPYANRYHPAEMRHMRHQRSMQAQHQERMFREMEGRPTVQRARSY